MTGGQEPSPVPPEATRTDRRGRLSSRKRPLVAAFFLCLVSLVAFSGAALAQTGVTTYSEDFQSYGKEKSVPGWVVNTVGTLKTEGIGRYKTRPDPTQGEKGANVVYGTKSSSGGSDSGGGEDDDDAHEHNGRNGTFATYTTKRFAGAGRLE